MVIPLAMKFFYFFQAVVCFLLLPVPGSILERQGYSAILFTKLGSLFSYNLLSSFKGVE